MASGAVAGCLGTLLGLGVGVFLVPFLNAYYGIDFKTAAAISLVTVIAPSSAVSAATTGRMRCSRPGSGCGSRTLKARGRCGCSTPGWSC